MGMGRENLGKWIRGGKAIRLSTKVAGALFIVLAGVLSLSGRGVSKPVAVNAGAEVPGDEAGGVLDDTWNRYHVCVGSCAHEMVKSVEQCEKECDDIIDANGKSEGN